MEHASFPFCTDKVARRPHPTFYGVSENPAKISWGNSNLASFPITLELNGALFDVTSPFICRKNKTIMVRVFRMQIVVFSFCAFGSGGSTASFRWRLNIYISHMDNAKCVHMSVVAIFLDWFLFLL